MGSFGPVGLLVAGALLPAAVLGCSDEGGPTVLFESVSAAEEAEQNDEDTGEEEAESEQEEEASGDSADSIDEGPDTDLANATDSDDPEPSADEAADSQAIAALSNEATAGAFCRWQAVIETDPSESDDPIADCETRASECQAEVQQASGGEGQLPEVMARLSDQLTSIEECDLAAETVDACMAEMIPVLEPYAETMVCGEEPGPFPSLIERSAELPTCLGLFVTCPTLAATLQGGPGAP